MRLIAKLDIKGPNLIKGVCLEGLKVLGDPNEFAKKYYNEGADELIFMDVVASLYNRNSLHEIIKLASRDIFVPFTVGGGIRSIDDALRIFDSGADQVAINTGAVRNPKLINELSKRFGAQAIVLSVEAKKISPDFWEPYIESGREKTDLNFKNWIKKGEDLGAGELLITSVDRDGTCKGFDNDLLKVATETVNIPVISSGGFGSLKDLEVASTNGADAIAIAHSLHYKKQSLRKIRDHALQLSLNVREFAQ